jgi:transposase
MDRIAIDEPDRRDEGAPMLCFSWRRIFLARAIVDLRKYFEWLSDLVEGQLCLDPYAGDVFVFVGRDRTRVKILV